MTKDASVVASPLAVGVWPASEPRLTEVFGTSAIGAFLLGRCGDCFRVLAGGVRATHWDIEVSGCGATYLVPTALRTIALGSEIIMPERIYLSRGGGGPRVAVSPAAVGVVVSLMVYTEIIGVYPNRGFERLYDLVRDYARTLSEAEAITKFVG